MDKTSEYKKSKQTSEYNKTEKTNRYREQIRDYLWRGKRGGARWDKALRGINYYV